MDGTLKGSSNRLREAARRGRNGEPRRRFWQLAVPKCHHRANATPDDTRSAPATAPARHKPPPWHPHAADASTATSCGRPENRRGNLSAGRGREVRKTTLARSLTSSNLSGNRSGR